MCPEVTVIPITEPLQAFSGFKHCITIRQPSFALTFSIEKLILGALGQCSAEQDCDYFDQLMGH